jgi:antitoxin component YwqK of YwqJK toxin-antitoxin module
MTRINVNELDDEYNHAGSLVMMWQGQPFTGIAFQMSLQGTLWCEQAYVEGTLHGISKEWYLNGQLKSQTAYKWNRIHGRDQELYGGGQPKFNSFYELGILLSEQLWDEHGNLVKDYQMEHGSAPYTDLVRERAIFQKYGLA